MTKIVTVFGGSGFVGKQVVGALARLGWRVRVAVRKPTLAYDVKPMGSVGQIQTVRCDVRRESDIAAALDRADACVNLVGIMYQSLSQDFDAVQRAASGNIAKACAERGIRALVQMSALGADPKSASKYAATKGRAEEAVRRAVPTAVILRPSVVFGPEDSFITALAGQIKLLPLYPAIGGAKTRFQPVYVGDVAAAVARTLDNPAAFGRTFELGGPEVFALRDLVAYVGKEIMRPRPQVWLPFFAARLIGLVGDIQGLFAPPLPKPVLTSDQVILLESDSVVSKGALGLKDLGIAPTAVESILPTYLWRFRKNGQFAVDATPGLSVKQG